ncbi:MAG: DUF3703 domain-containing protein [Polyangiales bacterium]|nr:DUF3703 domain-containing protein [Myxococcales bacterium]MCB9658130.1 DUF3703 domain-containing protein [Sandaracinaceae bacterium]
MLTTEAFRERIEAIEHAIHERAFDDAEQQLVSLHIAVHEQAALHQRVHLLWFRLGRAQRSVRMQAGQVFPIVFAVPVSLVHRYLGLAVGRHREPV